MADDDGDVRPSDFETAEKALHDALSDVMAVRGMMVTKWMSVVEMIDQDGVRFIESFSSPDYRAWDAIGMLGFLDARERGVIGAAAADEVLGDGGE